MRLQTGKHPEPLRTTVRPVHLWGGAAAHEDAHPGAGGGGGAWASLLPFGADKGLGLRVVATHTILGLADHDLGRG